MPPRLRFFNAQWVFRQQNLFSKSTFSTTARKLQDEPESSARELLSSMVDQTDRIHLPSRSQRPDTTASSSSLGSGKPGRANSDANKRVMNLLSRAPGLGGSESSANVIQELKAHKLASDLTRQITRRWKAGDVYAPHDLSPAEMYKWKKRRKPEHDVFDLLDMNPIEEYKNFSIMSEYMTPMGRILSSEETGLRRVNQRRISKAIRRSIGLGLMPSVHRHPEILYKLNARSRSKNW